MTQETPYYKTYLIYYKEFQETWKLFRENNSFKEFPKIVFLMEKERFACLPFYTFLFDFMLLL